MAFFSWFRSAPHAGFAPGLRTLSARTALILLGSALALAPGRMLAQRPLGCDTSHYQGGINWTNVKNGGMVFAWTKATESTTYTDPYYVANITRAKAVGIPIGGYHFARPHTNPNITGNNSAVSEANYYWSVVSNYVTLDGRSFIPMLDWEDQYATNGTGLTTAQMSAWVNQWCDTISNYCRAKGIPGLKPLVYTGVWYSKPSSGISGYPGLDTSVTNRPCNISSYPVTPDPLNGSGPSSSFPWSTWNFWQFADTNVSGGDSDVFKGTTNGLQAYIVGNQGYPVIASSPSSRTADRGANLTMTGSATGLAPLGYQWYFNGTKLFNATNNYFTRSNIQVGYAGTYLLVVSNSSGMVTSAPSTLTVNGPFTPVFADDFDTNSSANWLVTKSTTDSRVSFAYDYSGYGIPSAPNSVGGTTKGAKFEANMVSGVTAALNMSPIGRQFGGDYRLHFDMWINANGPFPAGGVGSTQLQTAGLGTAGGRVQWNSGTSDGVFFAVDGEGQGTDAAPDYRAYIGTTLQASNSGVYVGGTVSIRRCSDPYYSNVFPGGQTPPPAQGQSGGLDVGTVGFAWRDVVVNKTGNTITWYIDGLKIAAVTNASLTASNIFVGYWDPFTSLSSNTNQSFGIVDNVRVEVPSVAPTILAQPADAEVKVTSNAVFTVNASGIPSPNYQWRFGSSNIVGATSSSFTQANVQYSQAGMYSVVVSNTVGTMVSSNAQLSIQTAAPGVFQAAALQPDKTIQLTLTGDSGALYYVEVSTNMVNWSPLTNVTLSGGAVIFSAGSTTSDAQQYYRARSGP